MYIYTIVQIANINFYAHAHASIIRLHALQNRKCFTSSMQCKAVFSTLLPIVALSCLLSGCVQAEGVRDFADETNIQLWTCDGSVGQKWQVLTRAVEAARAAY